MYGVITCRNKQRLIIDLSWETLKGKIFKFAAFKDFFIIQEPDQDQRKDDKVR